MTTTKMTGLEIADAVDLLVGKALRAKSMGWDSQVVRCLEEAVTIVNDNVRTGVEAITYLAPVIFASKSWKLSLSVPASLCR